MSDNGNTLEVVVDLSKVDLRDYGDIGEMVAQPMIDELLDRFGYDGGKFVITVVYYPEED